MIKMPFKLMFTMMLLLMPEVWAGGVVVIGHPNVGKMDAALVQKIFMGKTIEVGGLYITPVNLKSGALRERFLQTFLKQDDEKYTAYWTVRRYIGKGAPPREFLTPAEVIAFVQANPGAIGYIDESDVKPHLNVVAR